MIKPRRRAEDLVAQMDGTGRRTTGGGTIAVVITIVETGRQQFIESVPDAATDDERAVGVDAVDATDDRDPGAGACRKFFRESSPTGSAQRGFMA